MFIIFCIEFGRTISFEKMAQSFDEKPIVTYVDSNCGITFYSESPTKVKHINRKRKMFQRSCANPKSNTLNDQFYCFIDEELTSYVFLDDFNSWNIDPAATFLTQPHYYKGSCELFSSQTSIYKSMRDL